MLYNGKTIYKSDEEIISFFKRKVANCFEMYLALEQKKLTKSDSRKN